MEALRRLRVGQSESCEPRFRREIPISERPEVDRAVTPWPERPQGEQGTGEGDAAARLDDEVDTKRRECGEGAGEPQNDAGLRVQGIEVLELRPSLGSDDVFDDAQGAQPAPAGA
ncbi:MAG: hypothetical protein M3Q23_15890 [Actinomycetota bacterium]|nr:hypothetical protein [Actinomycetota bacterium]